MNVARFLVLATTLLTIKPLSGHAQGLGNVWNHKACAVVLTYDDAIDVDLDNVLPALDSCHLQGTFYLIGASPVIAKRVDEWRARA